MVLYNALPKKEYERISICKTRLTKKRYLGIDVITHQGNSQVKDNEIDLLVQQYEQFTIIEEEPIDRVCVAEVSSASALRVLRRLGSIFTSVYVAVHKLEDGLCKELQFNLVDNSKLDDVYLLNRS
ncbi:hypothetical protein Tco_0184239 [Tanacetum coccineum]